MPTIPQTKNLNANSAQILNTIRSKATPYYRSMVMEVNENDLSSLRAVGTALLNNDGLMNEFLSPLLNRIGMVWVTSKLYSNPWSFMKKGMLELGEIIEDVFVQLALPHPYNPNTAEQKVFEREIPNINTVFHKLNFQFFYKQTIQNDSLRQAFLTWDGITDLIARITQAMYSSLAYDEFLITKYMIGMALVNGDMATETIPSVSTANLSSIVASMKGVSNLLQFMSPNYNAAGVDTYTDKADQYIILNSRFDATMSIEVLATAFNMDKAALMGRVILVDDFGTFDQKRLNLIIPHMDNFTLLTDTQLNALKNVPAILIDRDWFMIFDQLLKFTEIYNNEGLYWNYTLHHWAVFSYSPFCNAVAFITDNPAVTSITISPSTASIAPGSEMQFTANVTGNEFASKAVTWSTNNENVTISASGLLRVPMSVTGSITVTATSKETPTVSASATVTVASPVTVTNKQTTPSTIVTPPYYNPR